MPGLQFKSLKFPVEKYICIYIFGGIRMFSHQVEL